MIVNSLREPHFPVKVDASRRTSLSMLGRQGGTWEHAPGLSGHDVHERSTAMNIREVPLDDLVLDPNLNLRDRLDDFTVERYADSWERLPPITVFEVEDR